MTICSATPRRLVSDESGHIAITFALMGSIMFSSIGFAIDIGRSLHAKNRLQSALDAAAIAVLKSPTDQRQTIGDAFFYGNLHKDLGSPNPPHIETLGDGGIRISATMSVPTTISRLMRVDSIEISGQSIVRPMPEASGSSGAGAVASGTPCIHVMDPSATDALRLVSNANLSADSCDVYVRSSRSQALVGDGNINTRFRSLKVSGSAAQRGDPIIVTGDPYRIEENAPAAGNPFQAAIDQVTQAVAQPSCTAANTGQSYSGGSVDPGTYCGATQFDGVQFNPGLYVIASASADGTNAGRLTLKGTLDGSRGVSFYFAGRDASLVSYQAALDSVLIAPSAGATRGLLFFESGDRDGRWSLAIDGVNAQSFEGLVHLPTADVVMRSLSE